jgi:hypothetical protein
MAERTAINKKAQTSISGLFISGSNQTPLFKPNKTIGLPISPLIGYLIQQRQV